jgi:hypothetical protein
MLAAICGFRIPIALESNEKEISRGRVSWQTCSWLFGWGAVGFIDLLDLLSFKVENEVCGTMEVFLIALEQSHGMQLTIQ